MTNPRLATCSLADHSCEKGGFIILLGMFITVFLFFIALGVDGALFSYRKTQLQAALDSSSIRAADLLYQGKSTTASEALARGLIEQNLRANGFDAAYATNVASGATVLFSADQQSVTIRADMDQSLFFSKILPSAAGPQKVGAASAASVVPDVQGDLSARHFLFVLDRSDSMGSKMKDGVAVTYQSPTTGAMVTSNKKKAGLYVALYQFILQADGDHIGVVVFGGEGYSGCSTLFNPIPINDEMTGLTDAQGTALTNRQYALYKIKKVLSTDSGTPIACGMDRAVRVMDTLLANLEDVSLYKVVMMSDGMPTTEVLSAAGRKNELSSSVGGWCTLSKLATYTIQLADLIKTQYGASVHTINYRTAGDTAEKAAVARSFLQRIASDPGSQGFPATPCEKTPPRFLENPSSPQGTYNEALGESTLTDAFENIATNTTAKKGGARYIHPDEEMP